MSDISEKSTYWLDKLEESIVLLQEQPKMVQANQAIKLNVSPAYAGYLAPLRKCLDPEAIQKIRSAAQSGSQILSFNSARALAGLNGKVPPSDLPALVHTALDVIYSRQLETRHIEALVDHIVSGKTPQDFDHTQVKRKSNKKKPPEETEDDTEDGDDSNKRTRTSTKRRSKKVTKTSKVFFKDLQDLKKAGKPIGKEILKIIFHGWCKEVAEFAVPSSGAHHSSSSRRSRHSGSRSLPSFETLLQRAAHGAVYLACQIFFWELILSLVPAFLRHGIEWPFRFLAHLFLVDFPLWVWHYDWHHWGGIVITVAVLGLGLFSAFKTNAGHTAFLIGILGLFWWWFGLSGPSGSNPLAFGIRLLSAHQPQVDGRALNTPVPETGTGADFHLSLTSLFSKSTETAPTPVVASVPEQHALRSSESAGGAAHASSHSEPNPSTPSGRSGQATAFNGDDNGKALLEQAIAAITNNSYVKSFPVTPDSSMGSLMAVNRVTDLAVESEYSLRVGQSGQKVVSVTPSSTGLVIATEGGLPLGGLLGDGSKLGFYWEDVQTIYTNELDTPSGKTYQVTWTATNLNQPIVVQCHTPNNLNHLVSALEYFIKATQGKYVPVTGMPYLNQGMVIGDEGRITALWAGSPADQAASVPRFPTEEQALSVPITNNNVKEIGTMPTSNNSGNEGRYAPISKLEIGDHIWSVQGNQEQKGSALDSALQALPSGKQTINVVTPADWAAAREKESREHNGKLAPKLTNFEIVIP